MEKDMGKYINVQSFRSESYPTLYFYIVLSMLNVHIDNSECNQTVYDIMIIITTLIYTLVRNITNTHKSENIGCSRNRTCDLSITCRVRYPCAIQPIDQTPSCVFIY